MGVGRLVTLLSWVLALFGPIDWRGKGGGLSTILRPGLRCGAWSPSLDGDLDPVTGVEWVGLVYA